MIEKPTQDFARLVELQQQYNARHNTLELLEVTVNKCSLAAAEPHAAAYVVLQEDLNKLEGEIKSLFEKHPEWRGDKKSVATPYGSVEQRTATELEVANPALTVVLIEARGQQDKEFKSADF